MTQNNILKIKNKRDISFIQQMFPTLPKLRLAVGDDFIMNNIGGYMVDTLPVLSGDLYVTVRSFDCQNTDTVHDTQLLMRDLITNIEDFFDDAIVMLHSADTTNIVDYCTVEELKHAVYLTEAEMRQNFVSFLYKESFITDSIYERQMENPTSDFSMTTQNDPEEQDLGVGLPDSQTNVT